MAGWTWNSSAGRSYTIWRSTGLDFWEAAATGLESAAASTTWTDPAPPAGKAFYRVEAHYCR